MIERFGLIFDTISVGESRLAKKYVVPSRHMRVAFIRIVKWFQLGICCKLDRTTKFNYKKSETKPVYRIVWSRCGCETCYLCELLE